MVVDERRLDLEAKMGAANGRSWALIGGSWSAVGGANDWQVSVEDNETPLDLDDRIISRGRFHANDIPQSHMEALLSG
jgi:hypothetical protein